MLPPFTPLLADWVRSPAQGFSRAVHVAVFRMDVERRRGVWINAYILPSGLLVFISYMGLFIGNHNPGRPGVHAVTILTHLTIDASIRAQLPSISDSTWISDYQSTVLNFHVAIFVEFCVVHYAYRQKKKLKKKRLHEKRIFLDALRLDLQLVSSLLSSLLSTALTISEHRCQTPHLSTVTRPRSSKRPLFL